MANDDSLDVAIVGISCRFPGASTKDQFWDNLLSGKVTTSSFSEEEMLMAGIDVDAIIQPDRIRAGGVLDDAFAFDAGFFDIGELEAAVIDPQQRLFLQCAWEAFEDAGHVPGPSLGRVGVFAGAMQNTYLAQHLMSRRDNIESLGEPVIAMANQGEFLPMRVSYKLDLTGPSVAVSTACSTSLVAVHLASRSLLLDECEIALAGSAAVSFPLKSGYRSYGDNGGALAQDGVCRPFAAGASGMVPSSGVAAIVLKRFHDAVRDRDHVYAVIKGSAVNNDGHQKVGFLAPSVEGQEKAITAALTAAEVAPRQIRFVEAHGTGTRLGDPIEIQALRRAFRDRPAEAGPCAVGSVKSNIGHTLECAGIAGLIKASLALERRMLPPSLGCDAVNPELDLASSPFFVATTVQDWRASGEVLYAGVSSFGLGGTNAHAVLAEPPVQPVRSRAAVAQVLPVSARTPAQLAATLERLADRVVAGDQDLADVAFTLQAGRRVMACRDAVVAGDASSAASSLRTAAARWREVHNSPRSSTVPQTAFLFPGSVGGDLRRHAALYAAEPAYRRHLDAVLATPGHDLRASDLERFAAAGGDDGSAAALDLLAHVALARLWIGWGLVPKAVGGVGTGALAAAVMSGQTSLKAATDAARSFRGSGAPGPSDRGAVVFASAASVAALPGARCRVDLDLGDVCCFVSGAPVDVQGLMSAAAARGIRTRTLARPARPLAGHGAPSGRDRGPRTVERLLIPNVGPRDAADAHGPQVLSALARLRETAGRVMVFGLDDILAEEGFSRSGALVAALGRDHGGAGPPLRAAVADLWVAGWTPDWDAVREDEEVRRVPLPTYPFERRPHRADLMTVPGRPVAAGGGTPKSVDPVPSATVDGDGTTDSDLRTFITAIWADLLGLEAIEPGGSFFDLGGDSLLVFRLGNRLRETFAIDLRLRSLFDHPTVEEQVGLVEEALLAKIENMSAADIENLLRG